MKRGVCTREQKKKQNGNMCVLITLKASVPEDSILVRSGFFTGTIGM